MHSAASKVAGEKSEFSIAIVNYKTPELTKCCLQLLQEALRGAKAEVWVVDNNSADESTEYLKSLSWINFIERKFSDTGAVAHGRALDMVLERIDTEYLFLMHTDTFIYDPAVFEMMLKLMRKDEKVAAVGCLEQINRGVIRTWWRLGTRYLSHHSRRLKLALGIPSKEPKPYKEIYLKSFCALWNARIIKAAGLSFSMNDRIPGYELQDRLLASGYKVSLISPRKMFAYLDHVQAGTVSAIGGYGKQHRRVKAYQETLERVRKSLASAHES